MDFFIQALEDSLTNYCSLASRSPPATEGFSRNHPHARVARVFASDTPMEILVQFEQDFSLFAEQLNLRTNQGETLDPDKEIRRFLEEHRSQYLSPYAVISAHAFYNFMRVDYTLQIEHHKRNGHC